MHTSGCVVGGLLTVLLVGSAVGGEPPVRGWPDWAVPSVIGELTDDRLMEVEPFFSADGLYVEPMPEWEALCMKFREDFRARRGIWHVPPVVQSQRYDDPRFRQWQEHCPALAFNGRAGLHWKTRVPGERGDWIRRLPGHMPDGSDMVDYQYGTRDFKLFIEDVDNDEFDYAMPEFIFFADGFYSYWDLLARDDRFPLGIPPLDRNWNDVMPPHEVPADIQLDHSAEYRVLEFGNCGTERLGRVTSNYYTRKDPADEHYSAIIDYRNKYYILQVHARVNTETGVRGHDVEIEAIKPLRTEPERHRPLVITGPPYCRYQRK